jgi:toxin YoeB
MGELVFAPDAFKQYIEWQTENKKTLKRINLLINDIQRNDFMKGIGKPEPLKHRKAYSRRIDDDNRLVYASDDKQNLKILSCKGHYEE